MIQITEEQIKTALDKAYKEAGHNAYFGNGFEAGVRFALEQVKLFDLPVVRQSAYAVYPDSVGFDLANENTLMAVFRNEEQANKFGKMMWGAMYYIEKVDTEHFA